MVNVKVLAGQFLFINIDRTFNQKIMTPLSKEQFEAKREQSKEVILFSALTLFSEKGYYNTSISDIAKYAKISKGLMYNYFKSKEELLETILSHSLEHISELNKPALKINDPYKRMEFVIRTAFKELVKDRKIYKMFISLSLQVEYEKEANIILAKFWNFHFNNAISIFKEMGYENYKNEAYKFGASMDGIMLHYLWFGENIYPLKEMVKNIINQYSKPKIKK